MIRKDHQVAGDPGTFEEDMLIAKFDDQLERALQVKPEAIPGSIFGDKKPNTLFNEAAEMFQKISLPNKPDDETFANQLSCLL